jgi:hypothetical protein
MYVDPLIILTKIHLALVPRPLDCQGVDKTHMNRRIDTCRLPQITAINLSFLTSILARAPLGDDTTLGAANTHTLHGCDKNNSADAA